MREIYVNTKDSPCAKAYECCGLTEKRERLKWLGNDALYVADNRTFVKVRIATPSNPETMRQYRLNIDMSKTYLMDAITGTLYFEDGRCLSSTLISRKFERNDELARKLLLEKTVINTQLNGKQI